MPAVKDHVIKIIKKMPKSSTVEDIIEELHFKMQVDQGLKELDEGKGISHQAAEQRLSNWLKK